MNLYFKRLVILTIALSISLGYFAKPKPSHAFIGGLGQVVIDIGEQARDAAEAVIESIAKTAVRNLLSSMRNKILHSGPGGGPAFVTKWRSFALRNQEEGIKIGQMVVGDAAWGPDGDREAAVMCEFFREELGRIVGAREASIFFSDASRNFRIDGSPFKDKARCTIPKQIVIDGIPHEFSIDRYVKEFEGGFDMYRYLIRDENNFWKLREEAEKEIVKQAQREESYQTNDAMAGDGFLSFINSHGQVKTPSALVRDIAATTIEAPIDCLNNTIKISSFIPCAKDLLLQRFTNFRGIGEDVFQDTASDQIPEGEAPNTPTEIEASEQECIQTCSDIAQSACSGFDGSEGFTCRSETIKTCREIMSVC